MKSPEIKKVKTYPFIVHVDVAEKGKSFIGGGARSRKLAAEGRIRFKPFVEHERYRDATDEAKAVIRRLGGSGGARSMRAVPQSVSRIRGFEVEVSASGVARVSTKKKLKGGGGTDVVMTPTALRIKFSQFSRPWGPQ